MNAREAIIAKYDGPEQAVNGLLGFASPMPEVEQDLDLWQQSSDQPLKIGWGDEVERASRGLAGLFINPEHVELFRKTPVCFPECEIPVNKADYFVGSSLSWEGSTFGVSIVDAWRDRSLAVVPAIAVSADDDLIMLSMPGVGIACNPSYDEILGKFMEKPPVDEPEYTHHMEGIEVLTALRHIKLTHHENYKET